MDAAAPVSLLWWEITKRALPSQCAAISRISVVPRHVLSPSVKVDFVFRDGPPTNQALASGWLLSSSSAEELAYMVA